MQTIENQTFENSTVAMDGKFFFRCEFQRCVLIFANCDTEWRECSISPDCEVRLIGPAARTLNILQSFGYAKDFGKSIAASDSSTPKVN